MQLHNPLLQITQQAVISSYELANSSYGTGRRVIKFTKAKRLRKTTLTQIPRPRAFALIEGHPESS
jgi:hypothetical protein